MHHDFLGCRGYGTCRRRAGCPRKAPRVSVPRTVSFLLPVSLSLSRFLVSSHADRHRQVHGFHMLSTVLQRLPRPARDLSGPVLGSCLHLLHVVRFAFFFFCRPVHLPSVKSQTDSWYCTCMSIKRRKKLEGDTQMGLVSQVPQRQSEALCAGSASVRNLRARWGRANLAGRSLTECCNTSTSLSNPKVKVGRWW